MCTFCVKYGNDFPLLTRCLFKRINKITEIYGEYFTDTVVSQTTQDNNRKQTPPYLFKELLPLLMKHDILEQVKLIYHE